MATWSASLPRPTIAGYQLAPVDPVLRTEMEFGAARARRRTLARNDRVSVAWVFTDAEMALFRAWFDDAAQAAGGAAWFTINLAIGATGITSQEARFVGIWQSAPRPGLFWAVNATLEVR